MTDLKIYSTVTALDETNVKFENVLVMTAEQFYELIDEAVRNDKVVEGFIKNKLNYMTKLNSQTRIKIKLHLPAMGLAICLQRKARFGWKTVAWNYPSVFKDDSCERIEQWLFWKEDQLKDKRSGIRIAKDLMKKCNYK